MTTLGKEEVELKPPIQFRLGYLFYVIAFVAAGLAVTPLTFWFSVFWLGICGFALFQKSRGVGFLAVFGYALVSCLFLCCLILPVGRMSIDISEPVCRINMRHILLAMDEYQADKGAFPPHQINDPKSGQPIHSWRVLILPYLEQADLFTRYDLDEPWDGPNNRKLVSEMPEVYRCPSHRHRELTHYKLVTGEGTLFDGKTSRQLANVKDDNSLTAYLVEDWNHPVNWMKPEDISLQDAIRIFSDIKKNGSAHGDINPFRSQDTCSNFGMFDRTVNRMSGSQRTENWERLFGHDNGVAHTRVFNETGYKRNNYGAIIGAVIYVVLGVLPFVFLRTPTREDK